ncbi:MAG: hypothetical protein ABSG73_09110 [Candidatus Aminicenantales bacterium]|jgi:hypothetical protein
MCDTRGQVYLEKVPGKEKEARWSDVPYLIRIPGRPELSLFPDMLTWYVGDHSVEKPIVRSVSYFPWPLSLRRRPDGATLEMDYQSIHDPRCWISFKAAMDRSSWRADKFFQGENVGTTIGKPGSTFIMNLALLPINQGEKHVARDWPAEEIAATYRRMVKAPCARRDPSPEPDFPSMCLSLLEYAHRYFNLSRERAAWMLIEILRCEVAFETPGSRPS